jgi:LacI family transcriptional regulator
MGKESTLEIGPSGHQNGRMNQRRIPRLKDVARKANVSMSAASRILRGDGSRFGNETCKRVWDAAQELGWRRNLLVSGMQTGKTRTIGVLIPPFDSFWVGVLSGIHMTLASEDYLPITVWVGDGQKVPTFRGEQDDGLDQINRLLDRRVDGLILWPMFAVAYYEHFRELMDRRVPVAVIDHEYSQERLADSIETDEKQGATEIAQHLLALGHRRIACLSCSETAWQAWAPRRRGYFESAVSNQPGAAYRSWKLNREGDNGVAVAKELLSSDFRPTAVFAVTDHEAVYVYKAAQELGLRIPDDVSVVGFADLDFASTLSPPLTTMRQRPQEIGRQAARLIVDRIDGVVESVDPTTIRVAAELVVRQSTASAPSDERGSSFVREEIS